MSEQIDDQVVDVYSVHMAHDMPILVEREKLRIRIRNGILKLLLCKIDDLSAKFILELQRDLEEWGKNV